MRDYAHYFIDRKTPEKRGVSINRDVDWWLEYLARRMGKMLFAVLLAILFLVLKSFWQLGKSQNIFPVQQIQLYGNVLITRPVDIQKVLSGLSESSFFNVNLGEVASEIESLPWIDNATVERVWPNQLNITLREHQVAYRWGDKELVDSFGNRFANTMPKLFAGLPKLAGVMGHESEVIFAYQQLVNALGVEVERLDIETFLLNEYLSWELHLKSGLVVKFGRDNYQKRLMRFVDAYQLGKLPKLEQLESVDFRYNRGFAIKWKADAVPKQVPNMVKASIKI